jgi:hypothetical protein
MRTIAATVVVLFALVGSALAGPALPAPEIDPSSGLGAIAMVAGVVLIMRGRRRA